MDNEESGAGSLAGETSRDEDERSRLEGRCAELEEQLAEAKIRYELVLEASNDGVWDWDLRTHECFFSKRWKTQLGYEADDVENRSAAFFALIHSDDQPKVDAALRAHFRRRVEYDVELRVRAKGGDYRIIRSRGQAVWDDAGKPVRMAGVHTDITARFHEAEVRLQEQALIEAHEATIQALSTPVLELGRGVLGVPIIGAVDRARAERMTAEVLSRVSEGAARFVIADLTAAQLAEPDTLQHLVQMLRSVALLGAQGSICGVSPGLAQQMVDEGLSFEQLPMYRNLGEALRASR